MVDLVHFIIIFLSILYGDTGFDYYSELTFLSHIFHIPGVIRNLINYIWYVIPSHPIISNIYYQFLF